MVQCRCVEAFFLFLPTLLYSEQTFPTLKKSNDLKNKRDLQKKNWFKYTIKLTDTFKYRYIFLPIINKRGAQTSIVSFPHALITQWYSNEEHVIFSQPFLAAASFHSLTLWGHDSTFLTVILSLCIQ